MSQCSVQQKHQIWVINPARSTLATQHLGTMIRVHE